MANGSADTQAPVMDADQAAVPSTTEQQEQEVQRQKSALQDNIERNGPQSYYFAHKKRDTGEAPAPLPVHEVIDKAPLESEKLLITETIFSYQFLDDGKVVKLYVPLAGIGAAVSDEDATSSFQERSFELLVHKYKPGKILRLGCKELFGEIVTLRKKPEESGTPLPWSKLSMK